MNRGSPKAPHRRAVLRFHGELNAVHAPRVKELFGRALAHKQIIVDLTYVSFVDAAGLQAIISGLRAVASAGAKSAICSPNIAIRDVLGATGIDRAVPVTDTLSAARECLDAGAEGTKKPASGPVSNAGAVAVGP